MEQDHRQDIREAVLKAQAFRRMTLSGGKGEWSRITARPVQTAEGRRIQFEYRSDTKSETRNFGEDVLTAELNRILDLAFPNIHVQTTEGDLHIRITKKGKVLISRGAASSGEAANLAHDRAKQYPLPAEGADSFLHAIGIKNERGEVRPSMQSKFRQINGFISIAEPALRGAARAPVRLVDCGCGSAYLTFAFYHYMKNVRGIDTQLVGVDRNAEIIGKCIALRDQLGWADLDFRVSEIAAYKPAAPPDIVFSLHACDTATDEAIALGVTWGSRAIIAAPCCQHELHHKLVSKVFDPVLRQGILRERLAEIVTDTFRALALAIVGYKTEIVEFVAPEFTPKNLVIRAEKCRPPGDTKTVREYLALKKFWGVEPSIEALFGDSLKAHLSAQQG